MTSLNSGRPSLFWEWYFWFWWWFWGFSTIANSMVQKVWTNSMGVFRYSLDKFNYFWPFCVGLAYMCGRNALKSHSGTKLGIVNKLELLIWCFTNIHSKPQPKMSKKYTIFQLWPWKTVFPVRSRSTAPILDDAELYEESFEVWIVVVARCHKKFLSKNGEKVDFIHDYSKIFENFFHFFECFYQSYHHVGSK